jgi:hypothetical protein
VPGSNPSIEASVEGIVFDFLGVRQAWLARRILRKKLAAAFFSKNTKALDLQGHSQQKLVAGVGFEPTTFRL